MHPGARVGHKQTEEPFVPFTGDSLNRYDYKLCAYDSKSTQREDHQYTFFSLLFLSRPYSVRECQRLLGFATAASSMLPLGLLFLRPLQNWFKIVSFLNAGYPDSTGTQAGEERSSCHSHQAPVVLLRSLSLSSFCDRKSFLAWIHPPLSLGLIHSHCLGKTVQSIFQLRLQIPPGVSRTPVIAASKQRYTCALAHMIERKERRAGSQRVSEAKTHKVSGPFLALCQSVASASLFYFKLKVAT